MNGSVFPVDIYCLLMKQYLDPHDALRMARTCKRLWRVFTMEQRMCLEANIRPCRILPKIQLVPCPLCKVHVLAEKLHCHLRKNTCSKKNLLKNHVFCLRCFCSIREDRLRGHLENRCFLKHPHLKKTCCAICRKMVYKRLLKKKCDECSRRVSDVFIQFAICPKCPFYCRKCRVFCVGCECVVDKRRIHVCKAKTDCFAASLGISGRLLTSLFVSISISIAFCLIAPFFGKT